MLRRPLGTPWYQAYRLLREMLYEFHRRHRSLSSEILFERCMRSSDFRSINPWAEKFLKERGARNFDPIHLFASFSDARVPHELRELRLNTLIKILGGRFRDKIDFTGCPSPATFKVAFPRKLESQRQIWRAFAQAVKSKRKGLTLDTYYNVRSWYGVNFVSFTIFLFWIDSSAFLPLDKNTVGFLLATRKIQEVPRSLTDYRSLLINIPRILYREIVKSAYDFMHQGNLEFKMSRPLYNFLGLRFTRRFKSADFKVIAIKPLPGLTSKYLKNLQIGNIYKFYSAYDFVRNRIEYNRSKDVKLYNIGDGDTITTVNISAIAGRNGSGKSTLTELLYLAINNVSKHILGDSTELKIVEKVNVEVYYLVDTIYRIVLNNGTLRIFKYERAVDSFRKSRRVPLKKSVLNSFFYTVAVNYSHYALNSKHVGDWIDAIFEKNDSYQVPLAVNPKRKAGNIDINTQNDLVKSRLLSNLLEPVSAEIGALNLRVITENDRKVKSLKFSINHEKIKYLYKEKPLESNEYVDSVMERVFLYLKIRSSRTESFHVAKMYLFKKLVNISMNYPPLYGVYYDFKREQFADSLVEDYLDRLEIDDSHITFKYKQAVNYLRYGHLERFRMNRKIGIEEVSTAIRQVIESNFPQRDLRTIDLIPPSFLNTAIFLNDGSDFEHLSSGEKQRIHTVSSLVYHLLNINSVMREASLVKYSFVNIIFDEVELYFHPEMQRTLLDYLLKYLSRLEYSDLSGLNFCFVTHSPFILSDIPSTNILFLTKDESGRRAVQLQHADNTFGGNIHEMLKDNFFLDKGFMGEFAKGKIKRALDFLSGYDLENPDTFKNEEWDKGKVDDFIELIGEPLIKNSMREIFLKKCVETESEIDAQIELLQEKKKRLKSKPE